MISVIMGVYNGETTVAESVKSIMASTVKDIEFIICDDGSTDRTREILETFARDDARIKLLFNGRNEGLAYSLNCCLAIASGSYIARQDADDVSHSERLERQRDFLDHHSEFGFVGTSARLIHNGEMWGIRRYPRDVDEAMLLFYRQRGVALRGLRTAYAVVRNGRKRLQYAGMLSRLPRRSRGG